MTTFRNPEIEKLWESWRKMREDLQDSSGDSFDPEKYGKLMVAWRKSAPKNGKASSRK